MPTETASQTDPVIACNLNAIPAQEREEHTATAGKMFAQVQELKPLPNGYALRLPTSSEMVLTAARFIANESLCCSFFTFTLEVESNGGPIWLHLTGDNGVKEFITTEFAS